MFIISHSAGQGEKAQPDTFLVIPGFKGKRDIVRLPRETILLSKGELFISLGVETMGELLERSPNYVKNFLKGGENFRSRLRDEIADARIRQFRW